MRHTPHTPLSILLAALALLGGCKKVPQPIIPSEDPLVFVSRMAGNETKAIQENTYMGKNYNKSEQFKAFAAYSLNDFDPAHPTNFFPAAGETCSWNGELGGWGPATAYFWPIVGHLSFQAYSPAEASPIAFNWTSGFTCTDFMIPDEGHQYDLMYTDLVANRQHSDYTIQDGGAIDDEDDSDFAYNGVNLQFHHALSLVEVQACSALGSTSAVKYYIQKVVLKNAYKKGTFTSSDGNWVVSTSPVTDYTILDLSGEADPWQVLPGADEYPVSINPNLTLMLLPQTLNRPSTPDFVKGTDAYLEITYKSSTNPSPEPIELALTDVWEKGNKYTYQLVFSDNIEFTARITKWDDEITTGYYVIVQ